MAYYGVAEGIILVLLSILLTWTIKFHLGRRRLYKLAKVIPGPKGYPLIGNSLDFLEVSTEKSFQKIQWYFDTYPEVFKFWIGPKLIIGVGKPEDLEKIMNHKECLAKDHLYDILELVMGKGLFTLPVSAWKKHRKIMNPLFNQKILESFTPTTVKNANILLEILEKNARNQDLDILEKLSNAMTSFICEAVMGVDVNAQIESDHQGYWINEIFPILFLRISNIFYRNDFLFGWTRYKKILDEALFKLHNYSSNVVKKQAKVFRQSGFVEGNIPRKSFLDLLLQTELTEGEIRDEMNSLLVGERVYEETIDIIGEDREFRAEDLHRFEYTERCIKETMRIFPVGPMTLRTPTADIDLNDITIPKNSTILVSIIHTHRNPKYWKDPLKFDPDRFLSEETAKRHPYSYIPFSGGSRGCIAKKMAMISMKTIIPKIVRKFILKTKYASVEEVDLKSSLSLRPVHGFSIWVEPRTVK